MYVERGKRGTGQAQLHQKQTCQNVKEGGILKLPVPIVVVVVVTFVLDRSRWGFGVWFHHNPQSTCVATQITIIIQQ